MRIPVFIVAVVPVGDALKVYEAKGDTFEECVAELRKLCARPVVLPEPVHIGDLG